MAPKLKLPDNFRVRTFGSSRNSSGVGRFLSPSVTHVSETKVAAIASGSQEGGSNVTVISSSPTPLNDGNVAGAHSSKRAAEATTTGRKKKKTSASLITRRWQEVWACRFVWAEGEFNSNGDIVGVVCRTCTSVTGRLKILVPKLDNLEKHEGKRTCQEDSVRGVHMKKGDVFMKQDCKHLQFCKLWAAQGRAGSVADQLLGGMEGDNKRKIVQFSTLFHLLVHDRPMIDYERQQHLLRQVKLKNLPRKHWSETLGWEMSEHLHGCILSALKSVVQSTKFISISADEVTAVDQTSWVCVHVYSVQNWERIPNLLHLFYVSDSGTADHLTEVIMNALVGKGGLSREEIASKVVCFGADGVNTFQGSRIGVTTQIRDKWAPFLLGASCVSHRLNLVVETISKFPMVSRLEGLCQSVYGYFCRSNKRHAELQRLANLMETKGNKMVRNVETRWILMRSPAARILFEYRTLLVKMGADMTPAPGHPCQVGAVDNFDMLCDMEVLLSLTVFVPLLNVVYSLIKLSQARDIFICDFIRAVKLCQSELSRMFLDPETSYAASDFQQYNDLVSLSNKEIPLNWKPKQLLHLMFDFGGAYMYARCYDSMNRNHIFVTQESFNWLQDSVEQQFSEIAQCLISEIDRRFSQQDLLDAFGIVYPQYWLQEGAEERFSKHLRILKEFYATSKRVGGQCDGSSFSVPEMLSSSHLDNQAGLFKVTMKSNAQAAMEPPFHVNPVIKL